MTSEADLVYQRGLNDCLEWVVEDLKNKNKQEEGE